MSTLPSERPISKDVPVVTADGGTAIAYKDPNSPESIMRRAKTAEVQASVDSKYDTNVNAYEGFRRQGLNITGTTTFLTIILILLLIFAYFFLKYRKSPIGITSLMLFVLLAVLYFAYTRTE